MVNKSAGEVVGASQAGKENIEALETIDFTKMSYTQAKKIEMDTQVRKYFLDFILQFVKENEVMETQVCHWFKS